MVPRQARVAAKSKFALNPGDAEKLKKKKKHQLCSAVDIISPTDKVALSREKKGVLAFLPQFQSEMVI